MNKFGFFNINFGENQGVSLGDLILDIIDFDAVYFCLSLKISLDLDCYFSLTFFGGTLFFAGGVAFKFNISASWNGV